MTAAAEGGTRARQRGAQARGLPNTESEGRQRQERGPRAGVRVDHRSGCLSAMLDLIDFRVEQGGDYEAVRESQRRRGAAVATADAVVAADASWRALERGLDVARKALARARQAHRPQQPSDTAVPRPPSAREELRKLAAVVKEAEQASCSAQKVLQERLECVGNLVHEDAPLAPSRAPGCAPPPALRRRLTAAGLAESLASAGGWRASGAGAVLQQAWLARTLALLAARDVRVLAEAPLQPPADRVAKLAKLRLGRGDAADAADAATVLAAEPVGALHACSWLQPSELPLRYAHVRPRGTSAGAAADDGGSGPEVWVSIVCADDSSCWDELDDLVEFARALHAELLGLPLATAELSAPELAQAEARASVVLTAPSGGGGSGVELARVACEYDYRSRWLGIRCGFPHLGEPGKRFVHTVTACICRPTACLLALAAAGGHGAGAEADLLSALPDAQRAMWLPTATLCCAASSVPGGGGAGLDEAPSSSSAAWDSSEHG